MTEDKENKQQELAELIEKLPPEVLRSLRASIEPVKATGNSEILVTQATSETFSGPLPPPKLLKQYNEVHEGMADRVVAMAEREQNHRHSVEKTALNGAIDAEKRGQVMAFVICVSIAVGSMFLINAGHEISGSLMAGGTLIGLAYVFITGRRAKPDQGESNSDPRTPQT